MKIEDLFIGAWVQELSPTSKRLSFPMQVIGLYDGAIDSTAYLDFEGNEADPWEVEVRDLLGIPVTEELLLKNGFAKAVYVDGMYAYDHFCIEKDGEYWFIDTNEGNMSSPVFKVKNLCVHQLQTALRWGGVDLKIKV